VLAESLPHLRGAVLEGVLDELALLKDAASAEGLERFLAENREAKAVALDKAVRVLASLPSEQAAEILGRILARAELDAGLRRAALAGLARSPFPRSRQILTEFVERSPFDALAGDCRKALASSA
jgi:hypothetical protein